MNRNIEKNLRDIINDPDGNENSFSSDVNLKTMSKGKEDDFDRIEEKDSDFYKDKRGSENEYYVQRRGKEENVSDRIESVSPMKENKYKEELSHSNV